MSGGSRQSQNNQNQESPVKRRLTTIPTTGPGREGQQLLGEMQKELERLREENNQIRFAKDLRERDFENVMFENAQLQNKLENLENVFIGSSV